MRILYLHRTQGEEPESIHIAAIVEALCSLGNELRIIGPAPLRHAPDGRGRPTLAGRIKRTAPRWIFELLQLAYNFVTLVQLARSARKFRPDLIYERYALFGFAGVLYARIRGIPLILEVNTPYAQAWAHYYGLTLRGLARWLERRTLLAADHVITVSEVQRRLLVDAGIPAHHMSVCHNAIDPAWFEPSRHADPTVRERLGLQGIVVGFVGTMNRWQGIDKFPAVLASVFARRKDVNFLFVGDGEFRAQLEAYCRDSGIVDRVRFTGRVPHSAVPALVAAFDMAVLLDSNRYGSPMKIFEYLGMQKAVIAPGVPPVLEVLENAETGLVIEPGDAAQMSDRIVELAGDAELRKRLGAAGRRYVVAHHTWRANAQRILDAYEQFSSCATQRSASSPGST